jgi:heme/copper-type cytochrome/quinol oxidase subunit 2
VNASPAPRKEAPDDTPQAARRLSGWARFAIYAGALTLCVFVAFFVGTAHFESTRCSGAGFDGDCELAGLEGVLWAGAAVVVGATAIAIAEVYRARRRRIERRLNGAVSA